MKKRIQNKEKKGIVMTDHELQGWSIGIILSLGLNCAGGIFALRVILKLWPKDSLMKALGLIAGTYGVYSLVALAVTMGLTHVLEESYGLFNAFLALILVALVGLIVGAVFEFLTYSDKNYKEEAAVPD